MTTMYDAETAVLLERTLSALSGKLASIEAARCEEVDRVQEGTEWNLVGGVVLASECMLCKHKGDPTHGDFGSSFIVFGRKGRGWGSAIQVGPDEGRNRPYTWEGRTTRSFELAVNAALALALRRRKTR